MMTDGGPAFPQDAGEVRCWQCGMTIRHGNSGMSLRDYFAAQALAGWCAKHAPDLPFMSRNTGDHDVNAAYQAYRYADAMLKEKGDV